MSKLEELIEQYCPDGVEWKPLGETTTMKRGTSATKGAMQEGNIPVISGGKQPAFYCNVSNRTGEIITVAGSGAGAGYVQYWNQPIFVCDAFSIQGNETLNTKYVYYVLTSIQEKIYSTKKGGGVPHVHISSIDKFEIPVPPLPVQEEIVRILDTFTELQAELQAELQKRQQQYNFYRDTLLTNYASEQNVKEYCLGELFEFKNGLNASKEQFGHGKPIVNYVNVYKKNSIVSSDLTGRVELDASTIERYRVKRGDVFFTRTSETREEVGFASVLLEDIEDCVFSGFVLRARPITNVILPEFCKYCFATYEIRKQIIQSSTLTTRALTNGTSLSKVKIMIPPLEEQNRIVAILDRFDTLTNDLTSGLPAEMEKRRQQYEYYRDRLLTFKRKEA